SSMPLSENTVNNFYETNREKQITKSIKDDISIEKKRIRRTRKNRINLSERLKKYDRKWKNVIFLLNIEAVILIIIVISKFSYSRHIEVFAVAFSAYVILLQYFINEQKYSERSLKAHYHQLELADILNEMDQISLKYEHSSEPNDKTIEDYIDKKEKLLDKYQH